jgi:hypothetical protein
MMACGGQTRGMYPIDVSSLVRRETLGSRAGDPTLPMRPRRFSRLRRAVRGSKQAVLQSGRGEQCAAPDRAEAASIPM